MTSRSSYKLFQVYYLDFGKQPVLKNENTLYPTDHIGSFQQKHLAQIFPQKRT